MPGDTIKLNGELHSLPAPVTVAELLISLKLSGKPVVVELDGRALTPGEHSSATVAPGATIEIVTLAAGG